MESLFYSFLLTLLAGLIAGLIVGLILKYKWVNFCIRSRIKRVLKKHGEKPSLQYTKSFGSLLENGRKKLERRYNFKWKGQDNIIYKRFKLHLTRSDPKSQIHIFYIEDGEINERYYSEEYPDEAKSKHSVLVNFIASL